MPVRFHSRKRRPLDAPSTLGVLLGCSTSCSSAPPCAPPAADRNPPAWLRPSMPLAPAPAPPLPCRLSCAASKAASAASSSSWSLKPPSSESCVTLRSRRRRPPPDAAAPSTSATSVSSSAVMISDARSSSAAASDLTSGLATCPTAVLLATGATAASSTSPKGAGRCAGTGCCHSPSSPLSVVKQTVLASGDQAMSHAKASSTL
mmetsp:Transcript_51175/g.123035  ORF Transcript_51175/g.123035 Transcript_51175/m.123035 type:complete len:205 (-) Transcript_51175:868-1482(-)